jgi:hypothetical protein
MQPMCHTGVVSAVAYEGTIGWIGKEVRELGYFYLPDTRDGRNKVARQENDCSDQSRDQCPHLQISSFQNPSRNSHRFSQRGRHFGFGGVSR